MRRFLYQNSVFFFAGFFLLALIAFWPNYYGKIGEPIEPRFHTHGIAMTLWCIMLISQAYLIRSKRHLIHKSLGKLSYVLVPILILTTINLVHFRLGTKPVNASPTLINLALMLNATIVFTMLYGLAMYFKNDPQSHARYMIATIFPMLTPITDRIIYIRMRALVAWMPAIEGYPIVPTAGFILADIALITFLFLDWKYKQRWKEFGISLALLLVFQVSVYTFHNFDFWKNFARYFFSLPLS